MGWRGLVLAATCGLVVAASCTDDQVSGSESRDGGRAAQPDAAASEPGRAAAPILLRDRDIAPAANLVQFAQHAPGAYRLEADGFAAQVDGDRVQMRAAPSSGSASMSEALELRTVQVGRWRRAAGTGADALHEDEGGLRWKRGPGREQLAPHPQGVEQSWHFAHRPDVERALRVRVRVKGMDFAGEGPTGLSFEAPDGTRIRYGHGTWIDADGNHTWIPARFRNGHVVLEVPDDVIAASTYPAVLDPVVGPETAATAEVFGIPGGRFYGFDVASDGSDFLAVWARSKSPVPKIQAARVAADGTQLDATPIELGNGGDPTVAFQGSHYQVVWRQGGSLSGRRIGTDGTFIDDSPVSLGFGSRPDALRDGSDVLVAYDRAGVEVIRVGADGTAVGSPVSVLDEGLDARIGSNGSVFLVAAEVRGPSGTNDILAARLDASLTLLDATPIDIASSTGWEQSPDVASDGSDFAVAFRQGFAVVQRVAADGSLSGSSEMLDISGDPTISWDGSRYVVATTVVPDARRLEPDLTYTDASKLLLPRLSDRSISGPRIASAVGAGQTLVFYPGYNGSSHPLFARIDGGGNVLETEPTPVVEGYNAQSRVRVAHAPGHFLVFFEDDRDGERGLWAARVDEAGTLLDPSGMLVTTDFFGEGVVAGSDGRFVTLYRTVAGELTARAVELDGSLGSPTVLVASGAYNPKVASDGTNFLVCYEGFGDGTDVYAQRLDSTGTALGSVLTVAAQPGTQNGCQVTFDGTDYLVGWIDHSVGSGDPIVRRVATDGTLLDGPDGVVLSTSAQRAGALEMSADPAGVWVTWGHGSFERMGARFESGTVDPPDGERVDNTFRARAQTYDGLSHYLFRDRTAFYAFSFDETGTQGSSFLIESSRIQHAHAASGPEGVVLAAYTRWDEELGTHRLFYKLITQQADGTSCSTNAECASGYCVDGLCCNESCGHGDPDDCQACSIAEGASVDGTCEPLPSGTSCASPCSGTCDGDTNLCVSSDRDGDGWFDCQDGCPDDSAKFDPGICGCGEEDIDSDGDGFFDCDDGCPDDFTKIEPGACGCGTPDTDSDGDGTADCIDECPADPAKTEPGTCGCGTPDTDSDGDGTLDCEDGCPDDGAKTDPGICGCGTPDTDSDGDGTADCEDGCPEDPAKTAPGTCGCGTADTDSDGDGTLDCEDGCPDDGAKTEAGICGCGTPDTDSDDDGTADCIDDCPEDPAKTTPGICGCGTPDTDSDDDGTADCEDDCPADPAKTAPGTCGCGTADVDSDGDGTLDCEDGCPDDGAKTDPGICGCGTPDTDSDGDGTADCEDGCPEDPAKTAPGTCGCGTPDTDSDGDGTLDCEDGCPDDGAKTEAGACGCGVADTDSDEDGTPDCEDACPDDAAKTEPGICGCGTSDIDSDEDGTADCEDGCPDDSDKTEPSVCGCGVPETDSDGDGSADCDDDCPDDPDKIDPGACGCGTADVDSDGDGTLDCEDGCPDDGAKADPGICGCGTPDTDSDGDGTADCEDGCPDDAAKTEPGTCGCGIADADSDGDGTLDCEDGCPDDSAKTDPGICGCGTADTDSDDDGTADCDDGCPDDPDKLEPGDCGCGMPEGGCVDAGLPDSGVTDAGVTDAGVTDAGVTDAGVTDAGVTDAGLPDGGNAGDGGFPDGGGSGDAGVTDAGADAGDGGSSRDAGTASDAGIRTDGGAGSPSDSGCGCVVPGSRPGKESDAPLALAAAAALLPVLRRRRARRPANR